MWKKEDEKNLDETLEKLNTLDDKAERERYKKLLTDWHRRDKNKKAATVGSVIHGHSTAWRAWRCRKRKSRL